MLDRGEAVHAGPYEVLDLEAYTNALIEAGSVDGARRASSSAPVGMRRPGDGRHRRPVAAACADGRCGWSATSRPGRAVGLRLSARLVGATSCRRTRTATCTTHPTTAGRRRHRWTRSPGSSSICPQAAVCARCTSSTWPPATGRRSWPTRSASRCAGRPAGGSSRCRRTARRWTSSSSRASLVGEQQLEQLRDAIALLDDGQRAVLNAIASEAHATVGSASRPRCSPSRRRWLIARALVRWARHGWDEDIVRAALAHVTGNAAVPSADRAARSDRRPVDDRLRPRPSATWPWPSSDGHFSLTFDDDGHALLRRGDVKRPLAERFWPKVDRRGPDECWPWLAATTYGYGVIGDEDARMMKAHRVAWSLIIGPIPDGLVLDHLCRNRACCVIRRITWSR